MACILKIPSQKTKGVVVFTTPERDQLILRDKKLQQKIRSLKDRWTVGLHHNWHDYHFVYDSLFDFSMAGEGDLIEINGKTIPLVSLDACNFVPEFFRPAVTEKFWDILYIARAVFFKKIPESFECIRRLYDEGHKYRVLFVCPVPPYDKKDAKTVFYNIREVYDRTFSEQEKHLFTLLTLDYGYPFPLDLETLAFFYRSSRLFAHFADDERRCRVAAYAWASGLPVVGMSCVGSLLPEQLKAPPYYYEVADYPQFPEQIVRALTTAHVDDNGFEQLREYFSSMYTTAILKQKLEELFATHGTNYDLRDFVLTNLGIRLGRHHGLGTGPNTVPSPLFQFLDLLGTEQNLAAITNLEDPEMDLERSFREDSKPSLFKRIAGPAR